MHVAFGAVYPENVNDRRLFLSWTHLDLPRSAEEFAVDPHHWRPDGDQNMMDPETWAWWKSKPFPLHRLMNWYKSRMKIFQSSENPKPDQKQPVDLRVAMTFNPHKMTYSEWADKIKRQIGELWEVPPEDVAAATALYHDSKVKIEQVKKQPPAEKKKQRSRTWNDNDAPRQTKSLK